MNNATEFHDESNIEKVYSYDEETAKRDASRNSFNSWSTDAKERKKQYIIFGPITILIVVIGCYFFDNWNGNIPLPLIIIIICAYFYLMIFGIYILNHPYKAKFLMTQVYVLTKQKELYMFFANPNKIGQNLAIMIGTDLVATAAFKGNKTARHVANGASIVAVGINIAERSAKLNKYLSDPLNIDNILKQPNLMKELYVFKIVKTINITEKKNYYKGKFLIYDCNKNKERKETLNIGKIYKDHHELINQLTLKK